MAIYFYKLIAAYIVAVHCFSGIACSHRKLFNEESAFSQAVVVHHYIQTNYTKVENVEDLVRMAILNKDTEGLARLVIESEDVVQIGRGFTFSNDKATDYLKKTDNRGMDGDAIALKGIAKAAVTSDIFEKLADIFVEAIYGPDRVVVEKAEPVCTDAIVEQYSVTCDHKEDEDVKEGEYTPEKSEPWEEKILNSNNEPVNTISWYVTRQVATYSISYINGGQSVHYMTKSKVTCTDGEGEVKRPLSEEEIEKIKNDLIESFKDKALMQDIIDTIPEGSGSGGLKRRSLLIAGGTPLDSWLCAYCWQKKFCDKNAFWCPL